MKKNRCVDKDVLCKYDLSYEFFNDMNIKINDVIPLRKVFLLKTDEGSKILKKVDYDVNKLDIINESLNYIKKQYKNIITFNKIDKNKYFKIWNNEIYVVMDVIEGHECSFYNPIELKLCAENLALMHNASIGLKKYLESKYNNQFLDISLDKKLKNISFKLIKIKNMVSKYMYKNEFDTIFLNNVDKYIKEINICEQYLDKEEYSKLRGEEDKISLCHNDLAYHNFLINNNIINILDFDYMTIDIRIMDVADLIIKSIKNAAFDLKKMNIVLDSYEKINRLSIGEKKILKILLMIPKDFCSIVINYYEKKKSWEYDVFLNRLNLKMENEKFRYEFLEKYHVN